VGFAARVVVVAVAVAVARASASTFSPLGTSSVFETPKRSQNALARVARARARGFVVALALGARAGATRGARAHRAVDIARSRVTSRCPGASLRTAARARDGTRARVLRR